MKAPLALRARQAGVVALVLGALVTGRVVTTAFAIDGVVDAPFVHTAGTGDVVTLRYAALTAAEPAGSTMLDAAGALLQTPGVWVVIPMTITAVGEPARLGYAAVRGSDGRLYTADGSRSQFSPGVAQPGVPRYASVAVELPAAAAAGAHLLIALDGLDQRRDDLADIDLAITVEQAEQWATRTAPAELSPASSSPPGAQ
ncbi:hypothetical protein [Pengzhenrongella sicca]|uniref:Uncharacterized protein n=1 Tax=Pengzhenrongella sicca TaxID=2819238 RepID=A0A8A4ZCW0_9MICO|nr:hypothetical protein [Pengzhenrongella sicca]QTE28713.1 hypothetical protein J4E96_15370 [Pengzhenrongella sicca]